MSSSDVIMRIIGLEKECTLDAWSLAPFITLLALFVSVAVRYRGVVFFQYYEKRNTRPTRYCTITPYPYEAIIAFLVLCGPRIFSAIDTASRAFQDNQSWENRDFNSPWSWVFIGYFVLVDVVERISVRKRILVPYYKMKAQRATNVVRIEKDSILSEHEPLLHPADEEAANAPLATVTPEQPTTKPTFRARITKLFTAKYPQPTALNVLSQLHLSTFLKAMLIFIFFNSAALQLCLTDDGALTSFFDLNASMAPHFMLIGALTFVRFVGLFLQGVRFGQRELA